MVWTRVKVLLSASFAGLHLVRDRFEDDGIRVHLAGAIAYGLLGLFLAFGLYVG
jgi:hypothetical protein